jgi:hypothetical protein
MAALRPRLLISLLLIRNGDSNIGIQIQNEKERNIGTVWYFYLRITTAVPLPV